MSTATLYDKGFFRGIEDGSRRSARHVLPHIFDLVAPRSVVDVGCGAGAWLAVVKELGISEILGIDGDYVDPAQCLIPSANFLAADIGRPLCLDRRFDLVLSLEVAEHIAPERASTYIENLVSLGDVIAFSAAIPNQTGRGHVNEQWPDYWADRFREKGFIAHDCLRELIWDNRDVERWYRQNLFLYVHENRLATLPALMAAKKSVRRPLAMVHPASYMAPSLSALAQMVPGTIRRAIRRRLGKS